VNIRIDSVTLLSYRFAIISKIACWRLPLALASASKTLIRLPPFLRPEPVDGRRAPPRTHVLDTLAHIS
jgi:hypothetical protein